MIRNYRSLLAVVPLSAIALAACNNGTASRSSVVSLSVVTKPAATTLATAPAHASLLASAMPTSVAIAPNLTIESVEIVLASLELAKSSGGACTVGPQGSDGECDDFELAPMLVNTQITNAVQQQVSAAVPDGTYAGFEAQIRPVKAGDEDAAAFFAANPTFPAGTSVRVHGTYGTTPGASSVIYSSSMKTHFNSTFAPPVTVGGNLKNITLNIDVSQWFIDPVTKAVLDPTNPANGPVIDQNIRRSFRAFEDDAKEGRASR
ncbi:MAG: hypothetical protein NVS4B3_04790 [Gemmatimonadaceae bacterium]